MHTGLSRQWATAYTWDEGLNPFEIGEFFNEHIWAHQ